MILLCLVAERISYERWENIGESIGYKVILFVIYLGILFYLPFCVQKLLSESTKLNVYPKLFAELRSEKSVSFVLFLLSICKQLSLSRLYYCAFCTNGILLSWELGRHSSDVFCTNGILLRVLVSNGGQKGALKRPGKQDLSDITHIIVVLFLLNEY